MNCLRKYLAGMLLLVVLAGCGEPFPDEEMHLGRDNKTRPLAVILEPPEAAPGDTVTVTLLARTPNAQELDVTWRLAQDFDSGLYGADDVERNYLNLDPPDFWVDDDGFLTQSFRFVVPDSALIISSALPRVLTDPAIVALAEELIGPDAGSPLTKTAVDSWLRVLTREAVEAMEAPEQANVWALADRFACQVRFRVAMRSDLMLDVTRNLTIRHTGRLGGPNTNENAQVYRLAVVAMEKTDAVEDDLDDASIARTWYHFIDSAERVADLLEIPRHTDWTYYLVASFYHEQYTSPFNPDLLLTEQGSYRWYYYRQDDPTSAHEFFVAEDGTGAEMWNLDRMARIVPAEVGSTFRFALAVRDERSEWISYHAVPGVSEHEGIIRFVDP